MMFKLALVSTLMVIGCQASYGYGSGSSESGYGRMSGGGNGGYGGSSKSYGNGPIPVSIQTRHNVEYYDVPSTGYAKPTSIEVGASAAPMNLLFRSASSYLNVKQYHEGAKGSNQESESEDDAHYLRHTVKKPVYQEVREVISPYRKILQEIKPVEEEIQTIVARGSQKNYGSRSGGYGMSGGAGSKGGY